MKRLIGDSRLLTKLLLIVCVIIAVATLSVWIAIDFFAFNYFTGLLHKYRVPKHEEVLQMFLDSAHRGLLWAAVLSLLLGITVGFLLMRRVLSPLYQMIGVTRKIAQGDYTTRVDAAARDEIGELGSAFNAMTDRLQRIEELRRRSVVDVAHELRAPLTNIRGYLEAFSTNILDVTPEAIQSLHEETMRLSNLAEDLMRLSIADAARSTMVRSSVDLTETLKHSVNLFQSQFAEKRITIATDVPTGNWQIMADAEKLAQIFQNLLDNAWRYTGEGGKVRVSLERSGAEVILRVCNTAVPLSVEDRALIFERFYRVDKSRSREHGGAGIGLAIVKELAEAHGGRVAADSAGGENCMSVTLPVNAT